MRRRDDRGRRQAMRGIVVLGDADPVKAERLDVLEPLDHPAIGLRAGFTVIGIGRHRPLGGQFARRKVMGGLKIRDFHPEDPSMRLGAKKDALIVPCLPGEGQDPWRR